MAVLSQFWGEKAELHFGCVSPEGMTNPWREVGARGREEAEGPSLAGRLCPGAARGAEGEAVILESVGAPSIRHRLVPPALPSLLGCFLTLLFSP